MDRELEIGLFLNDVKNKLEELTGETIIVERVDKCNGAKWHGVRKATKKEIQRLNPSKDSGCNRRLEDV